ncbi:hypothetical protein [Rhizobium sp. R86522]|uniref:hypothetical protein n=1 Tax=Rhizobium sp. R86522 TaxID=3093861 RepID=UPI0036733DD3
MLIRTYADIANLKGNAALSPAEKKLIENCKRGELTTLGNGTRPNRSSKARTIRADLLRYLILGGCEQCRVHEKGVQLEGAWIAGQLDLSFACAKGAVHLFGCAFAEPIAADQASFDRLVLNGSSLPGLNAEGATIKGNVFLDNLKSSGEVSFAGAKIGGQLSCNGAELNGGEGAALNAEGATIMDNAFLDKLKSTGEVSFSGAEIGGQLSAEEAQLNGGEGKALNAQSATIRGGAFLDNFKSIGEVSFSGAEIGGQLSCKGADLNSDGGNALNVEGATIKGGAFLHNVKSNGEVSFVGADIGVQLAFDGAELNGGKGKALRAQRMIVSGGFIWRKLKVVAGTVDLNAAQLRDLVDDEQSWNAVSSLILIGATYENLIDPLDLSSRKRWLKNGANFSGQFYPQPYQQLAKFYRETGHRHEAREILVEKEKEQRKAVRASIRNIIDNYEGGRKPSMKTILPWLRYIRRRYIDFFLFPWLKFGLNWLWDKLSRRITGYGYKPWLSFGPLITLVVAMAILSHITWSYGDFAPNSDVILTSSDWKAYADGTTERPPSATPAADWSDGPDRQTGTWAGPGRDYETFNALAYGVDVVVPVLNLGQTAAWAPSTSRGPWGWWLFYLQKIFIIAGWGVTAIVAASISGMIRRDD